VLTIRTAGSMIAVVCRQVIDMTAREGDQDWSWLRFSHAFRFSSTSVQAPSNQLDSRRSRVSRARRRRQPPRVVPPETGGVLGKVLRWWGKRRVSRSDVDRSGIGFSSISVWLQSGYFHMWVSTNHGQHEVHAGPSPIGKEFLKGIPP